MAYYAVRVGLTPGVYETWEECQANVIGISGAKYKKFKTIQEAEAFVAGVDVSDAKKTSTTTKNEKALDLPRIYSFVDGSYNAATKVYGYGGFVSVDGARHIIQGAGSDEEMATMRNVAGEILGSMAAIQYALDNDLDEITILYDYKGIELWALDEGEYSIGLGEKAWKSNKKGTIAYREYVRSAKEKIDIRFMKVAAHTGIEGNEEADALAKEAVGI